MTAFKNRQEHLLSGTVVPIFLQGMDRMTWRSLTALGSVYSMMTVISFVLPVGLFLCESKTSRGNISSDFRASPFETELREEIMPPSLVTLLWWPCFAPFRTCQLVWAVLSTGHSVSLLPTLILYVTLSLQANSSLRQLLCSFQPPLWPQLLRL